MSKPFTTLTLFGIAIPSYGALIWEGGIGIFGALSAACGRFDYSHRHQFTVALLDILAPGVRPGPAIGRWETISIKIVGPQPTCLGYHSSTTQPAYSALR